MGWNKNVNGSLPESASCCSCSNRFCKELRNLEFVDLTVGQSQRSSIALRRERLVAGSSHLCATSSISKFSHSEPVDFVSSGCADQCILGPLEALMPVGLAARSGVALHIDTFIAQEKRRSAERL
jgi:hypothetical protein